MLKLRALSKTLPEHYVKIVYTVYAQMLNENILYVVVRKFCEKNKNQPLKQEKTHSAAAWLIDRFL